MAKTKAVHYVDNVKFLQEMILYRNACFEAKEQGVLEPQISEYVGECFLKIANRLSFRPNFINYAFREDMISDGIENCVQYIRNFDPARSKNPFAYFTQIIYYAFIRRIQKEKKQLYIKYKQMEDTASLHDNIELSEQDKYDGNYNQEMMTQDQKSSMYDFIGNFEDSKKKKKKKKPKKSTILDFYIGVSARNV